MQQIKIGLKRIKQDKLNSRPIKIWNDITRSELNCKVILDG